MAEAIAVVGVLSSVLQILEFTAKTASHTYKLLNSGDGGLRYNNETERLADEYQALGARSRATGGGTTAPRTAEEQTIAQIGSQCQEESRKLIAQLQALKIDPGTKGVKRLADGTCKAVKSLGRRKEVEHSRKHLHELNGQLATVILQNLLTRQQQHVEPLASGLKEAVESIGDNLEKALSFAEAQGRLRRQEAITKSLHFPEMKSRCDAIVEAYPVTYHWALASTSVGFREWLQAGNGMYWITGKAGSGKSTLSKFLCEHEDTKALLERDWCSGRKLVLASFYFWYAGTSLQKSIVGLLRTILYQMLTASPDMAEVAFPQRFLDESSSSWTYSELADGFKALASHRSNAERQTRFCLFIDGLDEYQGNHMELVNILTDLVRSPNIKMCISSRPWNAFRGAFEAKVPNLRLEDLSRPDIERYVAGSIDTGLAQCRSFVPQAMDMDVRKLVAEIVDKAEGVFLWVRLVVNSILRGLTEGDTIPMLRHRVREFPADLEEFFRSILDRVDRTYRAHTSQALKLACMSHGGAHFIDYWLIRQSPHGLADEKFAYDARIRKLSVDEWKTMRSETQVMLSAACKDLLCLPLVSNSHTLDAENRVQFLDRTVYDFLQTTEMYQTLEERVPAHFRDSRILHLISLARLKCSLADISTAADLEVFKKAVRRFIDVPTDNFDEAYFSCFDLDVPTHDLNEAYFFEFDLAIRQAIDRQAITCWDMPELIIKLIAYRTELYVLHYLDRPEIVQMLQDEKTSCEGDLHKNVPRQWIQLAAFGEDDRNRFGLEDVRLNLIEKLSERGLLVYGLSREGVFRHDHNVWHLFLRKWAISMPYTRAISTPRPHTPDALRRVWEIAKVLMYYGATLSDRFCVGTIPAVDRNHRCKTHMAGDFLKTQVPGSWLLESRHTQILVQDDNRDGKSRHCDNFNGAYRRGAIRRESFWRADIERCQGTSSRPYRHY
ncbi:hypothetical protein LTR36_007966 [Oleoguttula mirabilis]|uniref:NACHT domain-containing protein n=1 Tax=Oleoguttula mirabilis TaxID=1507867 RepID=A0AAV9J968_9PEZI|nr:hypothetical protein LTR36_007966 [Oleoguttula mirabilis]